jgi:hypothetical protein
MNILRDNGNNGKNMIVMMYYLGIFKIQRGGPISMRAEFFDLHTVSWWSRWGLEPKISQAALKGIQDDVILGKWVIHDLKGYRYIALIPEDENAVKTTAMMRNMQNAVARGETDLPKIWKQQTVQLDTIGKIVQDLNDTRAALHRSIAGLLQRGEKLEDLSAKSSELVIQSKDFKSKASRLNCWCGRWWCF